MCLLPIFGCIDATMVRLSKCWHQCGKTTMLTNKWTNYKLLIFNTPTMRLVTTLFIVFISCTLSFGQKKHSIKEFLEDCLAKSSGQTTAGSVDCIGQAYKMWDDELNSQYKNLMNSMNPTQKQKLKNAQVQWIKFRDLEFEMIDAVYADFRSMGSQLRSNDRLEVVKKRTLELTSLNKLINN